MEPRHRTDPYPPTLRTFREGVRCLVLGLLVVVATPQPSDAASMRGKADLKRYCTGDALSFCGGIDIDDPAMVVCFRKN